MIWTEFVMCNVLLGSTQILKPCHVKNVYKLHLIVQAALQAFPLTPKESVNALLVKSITKYNV